MTNTKQPRCLAFFDEEKSAVKPVEKPVENLDPKALFLDSMEKLLVELDDLGKVMEEYIKDKNL